MLLKAHLIFTRQNNGGWQPKTADNGGLTTREDK